MIDAIDSDLIAAASQKLSWEKVKEANEKPVLNLSAREQSPADTNGNESSTAEWDKGQRWQVTRKNLEQVQVTISDDTKILNQCPQLLRLDPDMVQETAKWVINQFDVEYLESEFKLLSYPVEDVVYGLDFMATMMMMTTNLEAVQGLCRQSTDMLIQGIEGGIQERAVQSALGAAFLATSQASKSIASGTMESVRQLRSSKRNKI
jgi:hypothetical protein